MHTTSTVDGSVARLEAVAATLSARVAGSHAIGVPSRAAHSVAGRSFDFGGELHDKVAGLHAHKLDVIVVGCGLSLWLRSMVDD